MKDKNQYCILSHILNEFKVINTTIVICAGLYRLMPLEGHTVSEAPTTELHAQTSLFLILRH